MSIWGITSLGFVGYGIYHFWRTIIIEWDQGGIQVSEETKRGDIVWPGEFLIDEDHIAFHFYWNGRQFSLLKSRAGDLLGGVIYQKIRSEQAAASGRALKLRIKQAACRGRMRRPLSASGRPQAGASAADETRCMAELPEGDPAIIAGRRPPGRRRHGSQTLMIRTLDDQGRMIRP